LRTHLIGENEPIGGILTHLRNIDKSSGQKHAEKVNTKERVSKQKEEF
jgi:hypothetical protein